VNEDQVHKNDSINKHHIAKIQSGKLINPLNGKELLKYKILIKICLFLDLFVIDGEELQVRANDDSHKEGNN
jgi:hypothetical protein